MVIDIDIYNFFFFINNSLRMFLQNKKKALSLFPDTFNCYCFEQIAIEMYYHAKGLNYHLKQV